MMLELRTNLFGLARPIIDLDFDWLEEIVIDDDVPGVIAIVLIVAAFALRAVLGSSWRITGAVARNKVAAGALLLDVRSEAEFRDDALPGAQNLPLSQLSAHIDDLESDRPIVVYCSSGTRSASAASMLRARGFKAWDLGARTGW